MWKVLNLREFISLMDERERGIRCLAQGNSAPCTRIHLSVTNKGQPPPGEEQSMKSKASMGTCLGSAIFLFFLSSANTVSAQSQVDQSSPQTAQPAAIPEAKPIAADASKATQTKSFT